MCTVEDNKTRRNDTLHHKAVSQKAVMIEIEVTWKPDFLQSSLVTVKPQFFQDKEDDMPQSTSLYTPKETSFPAA